MIGLKGAPSLTRREEKGCASYNGGFAAPRHREGGRVVARIACRRGGCSNPGFSGFKTGLIMNLMRSVLAGVCVALAASGVQARSWADIEKSGTLIAATGGDLKPFNYFEGKQLTGFEVELTDAIAKTAKIGRASCRERV